MSKLVLSPFALCKITSKAIELMVDCCNEKCGTWPVLVGENNHFIKIMANITPFWRFAQFCDTL